MRQAVLCQHKRATFYLSPNGKRVWAKCLDCGKPIYNLKLYASLRGAEYPVYDEEVDNVRRNV